MRTLIYSRVSTNHHAQNPEVQINELRRACAVRGWPVTHEITDHGYSGSTDNRPGLKQLLGLVRSQQVDVVMVVKLDRLFRSLKHLVSTLEEFEKLGVKFVALKDNVDYSTPSGRFFVQILGSLGEFERSLLRERTMLGLEHARSKGKRFGRPRLYDEATIRQLSSEGRTYREINKLTSAPMSTIARALRSARKSSSNLDLDGQDQSAPNTTVLRANMHQGRSCYLSDKQDDSSGNEVL